MNTSYVLGHRTWWNKSWAIQQPLWQCKSKSMLTSFVWVSDLSSATLTGAYRNDNSAHSTIYVIQVPCDSKTKVYPNIGKRKHIRTLYACTNAHTLVLVLARTGYVVPIQGVSQQEVTRLVVPLAAGALVSFSQPLCQSKAINSRWTPTHGHTHTQHACSQPILLQITIHTHSLHVYTPTIYSYDAYVPSLHRQRHFPHY